jgi:hypothetical protein
MATMHYNGYSSEIIALVEAFATQANASTKSESHRPIIAE